MLDRIRFHKYTALGNHLVLVDELEGIALDEEQKSRFAQEYADCDFGIGSSGVLFVQRPDPEAYEGICRTHGHKWANPDVRQRMEAILKANTLRADAILRIVEPSGQESAMCGNGVR